LLKVFVFFFDIMAAVLSSGLDPRIAAVAKKVVAEDERNRARVVGSIDSEKAPPFIKAQDVVIHKVVRRREKRDVDTMVDWTRTR
jgi:RecA/RadA recombinase